MRAGLIWAFLTAFFLPGIFPVSAQNLPLSPYRLAIINSVSLYQESLVNHPEKQMISLVDVPGIILDLRYASDNNFTHKKLYPENT